MVKTFSFYTRTENGTTSFESAEYFGEVQTDEKPEMMLKRVRFHTVTQQRADVFVPLCTCKVWLTTIIFFLVSNKKNIKNTIRLWIKWCSFLGKPHFLLYVVGCGKKVTMGAKRPESKVRKERCSVMKQENTTGQGVAEWQGVWSFEEFAARSFLKKTRNKDRHRTQHNWVQWKCL